MEKITINKEQLQQLAAMHGESGSDYNTLINSAIDVLFKDFIVELKRLDIREANKPNKKERLGKIKIKTDNCTDTC